MIQTMTPAEMTLSLVLDGIQDRRDAIDARLSELFTEFDRLLEEREGLTERRRRVLQEVMR